ncbi:hypothetical protein BZA77DRAFT_30282 [Pyronema omphalodes]|nr:hypothetical protein BZA77DRAFT_30282 [Pyronema omphalodes]
MHCFLVFDTVLDGSEAAKHEDFLTLYLPFGLFLLSLFLLFLAFWLFGMFCFNAFASFIFCFAVAFFYSMFVVMNFWPFVCLFILECIMDGRWSTFVLRCFLLACFCFALFWLCAVLCCILNTSISKYSILDA